MAEDPWYKRVVSPLRTAWDRVKAFASDVDPEAVANDAWRYEMSREKRRILQDNSSGKDDPQTTKQRLHESRERRRAAWRAFHADEPEPEIRLSWLDRWLDSALDRQIQPQRLWAEWTNRKRPEGVVDAKATNQDHCAFEQTERTSPEEGHLISKPIYGPRYLAAKAAYLAEVRQRHQDSVSSPAPPVE